jgi:hypothetical protein
MMSEQLRAVRKAQPFKPFKPFTIHLADGTSVDVRHPELLLQTQGGRTIFVNTAGEDVAIIDLLLVTKITFSNGQSKGRRR